MMMPKPQALTEFPKTLTTNNISVVILAGGFSARMGGGIKKEYRFLPALPGNDRRQTVLAASLSAFAGTPGINCAVVVYPAAGSGEAGAKEALGGALLETMPFPVFFTAGASCRRLSAYNALVFLEGLNAGAVRTEYVLIHDGARPWSDGALIGRVIGAAKLYGAAIPVMPLSETPKIMENSGAGKSGFITKHLKRNSVFTAQTPQGFLFEKILYAHKKACETNMAGRPDGEEWTDDAEIYAEFAGPVFPVGGSPGNKKITWPEDLNRCGVCG